jgi:hypothetical protein
VKNRFQSLPFKFNLQRYTSQQQQAAYNAAVAQQVGGSTYV